VTTPVPLLLARTVLHITKNNKNQQSINQSINQSISQPTREENSNTVYPISNETQMEGVKPTMEHWWSVDGSVAALPAVAELVVAVWQVAVLLG
jgi:hypothetical protein